MFEGGLLPVAELQVEEVVQPQVVELQVEEVQRQVAETAKARVPNSVTEIEAAGTFWPAEVYHQQ